MNNYFILLSFISFSLSFKSFAVATVANCSGEKEWILGKKAAQVGFNKIRGFHINGASRTLEWCVKGSKKHIASQSLDTLRLNNVGYTNKKPDVFAKEVQHVSIPLTGTSRGRKTLVLYKCEKGCSNLTAFIEALKVVKNKPHQSHKIKIDKKYRSKMVAMDSYFQEFFDPSHLVRDRKKNIKGQKPLKTFIVGAGPIGLMAAIELYLLGGKVRIIQDRELYIREPIFGLNKDFRKRIKYFLTTSFDRSLQKRFDLFSYRPGWPDLSKKDTEFYSLRIQHFEHIMFFLLRALHKKDPGNIEIYRGTVFYDVEKNRKESNLLVSQGKKRYKFNIKNSIVIGADGSKGRVKKSIAGTNILKVSEAFKVNENLLTYTHKTAIGIFKNNLTTRAYKQLLNSNLRIRTNYSKTYDIGFSQQLKTTYGWEKPKFFEETLGVKYNQALPATRVFISGAPKTSGSGSEGIIYIGTELPENHNFSRAELNLYLKALLKRYFRPGDIKGGRLELLSDDYTKPLSSSTAMETRLSSLEDSIIRQNSHNILVAFLGDSYATPHFLTRSGVNNGFKMIKNFKIFFKVYIKHRDSYSFSQSSRNLIKNALKIAKDSNKEIVQEYLTKSGATLRRERLNSCPNCFCDNQFCRIRK